MGNLDQCLDEADPGPPISAQRTPHAVSSTTPELVSPFGRRLLKQEEPLWQASELESESSD